MADKPTYDSQAPPLIKFQDALSGPAGEYSDAYQNIVRQYRDDVASGTALRNFQQDQQYAESGLTPPSLLAARTGLRPPAHSQYLKSGQDWYQIGANGKPQLVVDAPEIARPSRIIPQNELAGVPVPEGYQPVPYGTSGYTMERKPRATMEETLQALMSGGTNAPAMQPPPVATAPPINPAPGLQPPAYRPAPMIAPGETLPAGTIYQGGTNAAIRLKTPTQVAGNRLDAPPSTTQAAAVKKIRVKRPDGKTGTMNSNEPLPKGWVVIE